jgi:steroid 5-alpha reductase family enzyme
MMKMLLTVLSVWAGAAVVLALVFFVVRRKGHTGVVDVFWSCGVGATAIVYALVFNGHPLSRLLLAVLAGVWSFRLGTHILIDRVLGHEEDGRYQQLLREWGDSASRKLFFFFQYQALFIVVFSLPFLPLARAPGAPNLFQTGLAIFVWAGAIAGEALADAQLARWRGDPANRGRTCRRGLWNVSRHPNYFFEWLYWWTWVIAGITAPMGWLTLIGPVLMLFFLYRVTGIPHTEAQALRSRGEDYRRYQQEVSAFFPWFPKKGAGS